MRTHRSLRSGVEHLRVEDGDVVLVALESWDELDAGVLVDRLHHVEDGLELGRP